MEVETQEDFWWGRILEDRFGQAKPEKTIRHLRGCVKYPCRESVKFTEEV
jgi:hypothetical protein